MSNQSMLSIIILISMSVGLSMSASPEHCFHGEDLSANSEENFTTKLDSVVYDMDGRHPEKHHLHFDGYGNEIMRSISFWRDSSWTLKYQYEFTYDSLGNRLTYYNPKEQKKIVWSYNLNRGITSQENKSEKRSGNTLHYVSSKTEWNYDTTGKVISKVGGYKRDEFRYNKKGETISCSTFIYTKQDSFPNKLDKVLNYKYDVLGRLILKTYLPRGKEKNKTTTEFESVVFGRGASEIKWEYTYDRHGNRITQTKYGKHGEKWIDDVKFEYRYDYSLSPESVACGNYFMERHFNLYVGNVDFSITEAPVARLEVSAKLIEVRCYKIRSSIREYELAWQINLYYSSFIIKVEPPVTRCPPLTDPALTCDSRTGLLGFTHSHRYNLHHYHGFIFKYHII